MRHYRRLGGITHTLIVSYATAFPDVPLCISRVFITCVSYTTPCPKTVRSLHYIPFHLGPWSTTLIHRKRLHFSNAHRNGYDHSTTPIQQ